MQPRKLMQLVARIFIRAIGKSARKKTEWNRKTWQEKQYTSVARDIAARRGEQWVRLCRLRAQCPFYTCEEKIAAIRRAKAAFTPRFSSRHS